MKAVVKEGEGGEGRGTGGGGGVKRVKGVWFKEWGNQRCSSFFTFSFTKLILAREKIFD